MSPNGIKGAGSTRGVGAILMVLIMGAVKSSDNVVRHFGCHHADEVVGAAIRSQKDEALEGAGKILAREGLERSIQFGQNQREQRNRQYGHYAEAMTLHKESLGHGRIVVREADHTFRKEDDGFYYLTSSRQVEEWSWIEDGIRQPDRERESGLSPFLDSGGFERIQLRVRPNGSAYVQEEVRLSDQQGRYVTFAAELPVRFLEGSWERYTMGSPVRVQVEGADMEQLVAAEAQRMANRLTAEKFEREHRAAFVQCELSVVRPADWVLSIEGDEVRAMAAGPAVFDGTARIRW